MYRIIISSLALVAIIGCGNDKKDAQGEKQLDPSIVNIPFTASSDSTGHKENFPVIKFDNEVHDFGTIVEGEKVSFAYTFTNVGKAPLLIRNTTVTCGCTVPEFSKDPIEPGKTGVINVTFNSEGKSGHQDKTVTVIANTNPNTTMIHLTCEVTPKQ